METGLGISPRFPALQAGYLAYYLELFRYYIYPIVSDNRQELHLLYGSRIVQGRLWLPTGPPNSIINYAHLMAFGDKRVTVHAAIVINVRSGWNLHPTGGDITFYQFPQHGLMPYP